MPHVDTFHPYTHLICTPKGDQRSLGLLGLRGMGGVGKTTIAIAVARSDGVEKAYGPDNIWWIGVGQERTEMDVLAEFARKVCLRVCAECVSEMCVYRCVRLCTGVCMCVC